jgi:hypothetical protein
MKAIQIILPTPELDEYLKEIETKGMRPVYKVSGRSR